MEIRHFWYDVEVIAAVDTWLDGQPSELFLSGLQRLEFGCCSLFPSSMGYGLISTPVHSTVYKTSCKGSVYQSRGPVCHGYYI